MAEDERDQGTWIGGLLEAAAHEYEPDGERLRDLVASRVAQEGDGRQALRRGFGRGRRAGVAPGGGGLRTRLHRTFSAGAAIAAVGSAVAIAVGVTAMLAVTSPSPATDRSGVHIGDGTTPTGRAGTSTVVTAAPSTAASPGRTSPPLPSSDSYVATERVDQSSNPNWAQLDVVVTAKEPLTALEITISVADCAGLGMPKSFDTGAYGAFAASTASGPDGSVSYVFSLVPGQSLAPGTVEFAAQFNHGATGWSQGSDTYRISARTAGAAAPVVAEGAY
jgi:hypothetical protein